MKFRTVRKVMLFSLLSVFLLLMTFYGVFLAILKITETTWLGQPPFHAATDFSSKEPHSIALVDNGADSLALRLRSIEKATESIDLEFFIYELDESSRLTTQAIIAKAKQGVKVRVLVDFSLAVFKLRPAYAKVMKAAGIEVKYYNTAGLARFFSIHHRTHRKILLIDGKEATIGGRNIADDYFDLGAHYNFLDSDVIVEGPAVVAMRETFDLYWNSPWAVLPEEDTTDIAETDISVPTAKDIETLALITSLETKEIKSVCSDVRFITDYPGSGVNMRRVFPAITELLAFAKKEVLAESPYLVLREDGQVVVKELTKRGVALKILTNSLRSTDAYYTVAPLIGNLSQIKTPGFKLYAYGGYPLDDYGRFPPRSERWGVHSKRAVIDDETVLIGTYNIDPRSANLNSELMLVCKGSPDLAAEVRASIEARIRQANLVLDGDENPNLSGLIAGADTKSIVLMLLSMPLSSMFDFLL
jgi:putative cardiolipin synthase